MTIRRVLQAVADASTWLDCAMVRCAHSLGQACLDGLAVYGLALHGLHPDWSRVSRGGERAEEPTGRPDARLVRDVIKPVTEEQRRRLQIDDNETVKFGHVEFTCGDHALSETDNSYGPPRLTAEIAECLKRRTFLSRAQSRM